MTKKKISNPNKAVTVLLPDAAGNVSRSEGVKFAFKNLFHLGSFLATVGLNNPAVTRDVADIFRRPNFMPGYGDGKVSGAQDRGLTLSAATFDVDDAVSAATFAWLYDEAPYERLLWTTRSFTEDDLHLRLVVALNRPLRSDAELVAMTDRLNGLCGGGIKRIKNLNHLHDCPLAASDVRHVEGNAFDIEGLMATHALDDLFDVNGTAPEPEPPPSPAATIRVAGTTNDVRRHWENIAAKHLERLMTMGAGTRSDTAASVGAIIGSAFQGAVDKGVALNETETLSLLEQAVRFQEAAWSINETDKFVATAHRQFSWGKERPFNDMGRVNETDELTLTMLRFKERKRDLLGVAMKTIYGIDVGVKEDATDGI